MAILKHIGSAGLEKEGLESWVFSFLPGLDPLKSGGQLLKQKPEWKPLGVCQMIFRDPSTSRH